MPLGDMVRLSPGPRPATPHDGSTPRPRTEPVDLQVRLQPLRAGHDDSFTWAELHSDDQGLALDGRGDIARIELTGFSSLTPAEVRGQLAEGTLAQRDVSVASFSSGSGSGGLLDRVEAELHRAHGLHGPLGDHRADLGSGAVRRGRRPRPGDAGGEVSLSELQTIETGALPSGMPRPVWGLEASDGVHRMHPSPDGRGIITYGSPAQDPEFHLHDRAFDGSTRWELRVEGGRQDFAVVDERTFLVLTKETYDVAFRDGSYPVSFDRLVEVDREGHQRTLWRVEDMLPPDRDQLVADVASPEGFLDHAHTNYVHCDTELVAVFLTMRQLHGVVRVERPYGAAFLYVDHLGAGEQPW